MDSVFDVGPGPLAPWCPCVAVRLKSSCQATVMRNPHPSTARDHLGIRCYFASLFHVPCLCAPSVCRLERRLSDRFPLRTWHITLMPGRPAGWEKTAAARHSSQPHQSLRRQTWRPWAPWKTCSLTSLLSVTQRRSWLTDWMTDWGGKYAECQADSHLMDRCGGEHSIISFFFNFTTLCRNGKLLLFSSDVFDRGVTTGGLQMTFLIFFFTIALRICSVLPFWMHVYSSSMCGCQVNTSLGDRTLWPF